MRASASQAVPQRGPGGAVPYRHAMCLDSTGAIEVAGGVEQATAHLERIGADAELRGLEPETALEWRPCGAVPARDPSQRLGSAAIEPAARHQLPAVHGEAEHVSLETGAHGKPARPVPAGDVADLDPADSLEPPADDQRALELGGANHGAVDIGKPETIRPQLVAFRRGGGDRQGREQGQGSQENPREA